MTKGFRFALQPDRSLSHLANPGQCVSHLTPKILLQTGRGAGTNIVPEVLLEGCEAAASVTTIRFFLRGILYMKAAESGTAQISKHPCRSLLLFKLAAFFQYPIKHCGQLMFWCFLWGPVCRSNSEKPY